MIWRTGEFSLLPLPRRLRRPLAGDGDGADAARPPGLPARHLARRAAAALDRRPLLRDLPLADADHRPHLAAGRPAGRACCATSSRWRRSSPSPRSPGNSSRSRSATARSAASSPAAARSAGAGRPSRRRCAAVIVATGVVAAWSPPPAWPGSTRPAPKANEPGRGSDRGGDDEAAAADPQAGGRLDQIVLQSGRPHRRLDLRGPRLGRIPADSKASGSPTATPKSGSKKCTWRCRARARSKSGSKANRTPRKSPRRGRPKASKAAGCWRWGPTRRPTSPPAPTSASANGSKK